MPSHDADRSRAGRPPFRRRFRRGWFAALALLGSGLLTPAGVAALYALTLAPELPRPGQVRNPDLNLAAVVYTADGVEIGRFFHENRTWAPLERISPHVVHALVATEDHRFYRHWGVDVQRMISSAYFTARGDVQGGSTITMQLTRNLYPDIGRAPSLERKVKEILTAFKIERAYSKDHIIEMYLNTVPFGRNAFGIEAAAETYFSKSAADLDPAESALLVGMLKGTTRYNPMRNPEPARARRDVVLALMAARGGLAPADARAYRAEPVRLRPRSHSITRSIAPHFAEYVREWLEGWGAENGYDVYGEGLHVYTTLDARMQAQALAAVEAQGRRLQAVADYEWSRAAGYHLGSDADAYARRSANAFGYFWNAHPRLVDEYLRADAAYGRLRAEGRAPADALRLLRADAAFMDSLRAARTRLETGLVAIEPGTGYVRAWVGGRDFEADQFDKVGLARRQPGSTFKPFVYTAAVDWGYTPDHRFRDTLTTLQIAGSDETWTPRNAGGRYSGAEMTLREGLVYSKNTITAQLMAAIGPQGVAAYARRMGVTSPLEEVPSLGLGTSEVTLLEMTSAYATLAAGGVRTPPVIVTRIEDKEGHVLASFDPHPRKAISMHTAYTVLDMLRDVVRRGTGSPVRWMFGIDGDVAGKTGTTQNGADGWFLLMHPNLVTGAWVGFNDRRITFRSSYWGQGGHNALYVAGGFVRGLLGEGLLPREAVFSPPPGYAPPAPFEEPEVQDAYLEGWSDPFAPYEAAYDTVGAASPYGRPRPSDADSVRAFPAEATRAPKAAAEALPAAEAVPLPAESAARPAEALPAAVAPAAAAPTEAAPAPLKPAPSEGAPSEGAPSEGAPSEGVPASSAAAEASTGIAE